ncbi:MAG: hypothetical protein GTN81_01070 [Proteobacteria bacterium]|nr:hypothetical protein [Pseudomonadota bacterium]
MKGLEPISVTAMAEKLNVAVESLEQLLLKLRDATVLAPIDEAHERYVLIKDLDNFTPKEIIESLGGESLRVPSNPEDVEGKRIRVLFNDARQAGYRVLQSQSVRDLLSVEGAHGDGEDEDPMEA